MFNSTRIATKLKNTDILYSLDEDESEQLKSCLVSILVDFIDVCEKYNLCYMLSGGSALGAVRHKGFIPWDDDLDVMMPRDDYNKFIEVFEKELADKYYIRVPNSKYDVSNTFLKLVKKRTRLVDMYNINTKFYHGISIDVFPIENAPKNILVRHLKGFCCDLMAYIGVSIYMYKFRNSLVKSYFSLNFEGKLNYYFRLLLGFMFCIVDYKKWYKLYDRFAQQKKSSGMKTIPTGRKHYCGEALPEEVFFPVSKGDFEGLTVNLPNNPDAYLKNLYSDYMKIPPVDKRERHFVVEFKVNTEP